MRELKFRAWNGEYMEHGGFAVHATGEVFNDSGFSRVTSESPVMQYTGLKDKNGKEIYEGDFLLVNNNYKEVVDMTLQRNEKRGHGETYFVVGLNIVCGYAEDNKEYEVIGNIYENPELLEK